MKNEKQKALIDRYLAAYNSFDIDAMIALVHPEIVFKNVSGGEVNAEAVGTEQFRKMANQSKEMFSSRRQQANNFKSDNGLASVDIVYEAVLATDLPNGMKKGEQLQLTGRSEFTFADGKISSITDFS
ncbi:MAG: nuclear transport factor 2 family protein [Cyanobacteria bacterium P01_A01_bin.116]